MKHVHGIVAVHVLTGGVCKLVPAGGEAVCVPTGGGDVHVPDGGGDVHGAVSEMESGGVTWIIMLLLCVADHRLSVNLQEEIDEDKLGAAWGADV